MKLLLSAQNTCFSFKIVADYSPLDQDSPKCDGKLVEAGTGEQEFVTALNTLEACEADIQGKCPALLTEADNTTINSCFAASTNFKAAMSDCMDDGKFVNLLGCPVHLPGGMDPSLFYRIGIYKK